MTTALLTLSWLSTASVVTPVGHIMMSPPLTGITGIEQTMMLLQIVFCVLTGMHLSVTIRMLRKFGRLFPGYCGQLLIDLYQSQLDV